MQHMQFFQQGAKKKENSISSNSLNHLNDRGSGGLFGPNSKVAFKDNNHINEGSQFVSTSRPLFGGNETTNNFGNTKPDGNYGFQGSDKLNSAVLKSSNNNNNQQGSYRPVNNQQRLLGSANDYRNTNNQYPYRN